MKVMNCPLNGPRNIDEFSYGGEYHPLPDRQSASDREWIEYVHFHRNPAGRIVEWWCHTPTAFWFLAERDTVTDEIVRTFQFAELERGQAGD